LLVACGTSPGASVDGGAEGDGGAPLADGGPPPADGGATGGWLSTRGNHILTPDGRRWHGRGANLPDTRSCNACAYATPVVSEVIRRIDTLVDGWRASLFRLTLESYAAADGRMQWQGVLDDPAYLDDLRTIVNHAGTKPGAYVLLSLWVDPSFSSLGWPTAATQDRWRKLAETFLRVPHVLYGLVNEPQYNFDGSQDADVWTAMNDTVRVIRSVEDANGAPHHVIAVQGTGGWARRLDYYIDHPITAGGGDNVAYEVHVYDPTSEFDARFATPSLTLPVLIGEFGPVSGDATMTAQDCDNLMARAESLEIPYLAWTFHMRCDPSLLVDHSNGGCGVGMTLEPTAWGAQIKNRFATPW
jgi:endoglucanase